jgi:hypothetical protein
MVRDFYKTYKNCHPEQREVHLPDGQESHSIEPVAFIVSSLPACSRQAFRMTITGVWKDLA